MYHHIPSVKTPIANETTAVQASEESPVSSKIGWVYSSRYLVTDVEPEQPSLKKYKSSSESCQAQKTTPLPTLEVKKVPKTPSQPTVVQALHHQPLGIEQLKEITPQEGATSLRSDQQVLHDYIEALNKISPYGQSKKLRVPADDPRLKEVNSQLNTLIGPLWINMKNINEHQDLFITHLKKAIEILKWEGPNICLYYSDFHPVFSCDPSPTPRGKNTCYSLIRAVQTICKEITPNEDGHLKQRVDFEVNQQLLTCCSIVHRLCLEALQVEH